MSAILHILPPDANPREYDLEWYFNIPPFSTGIARGAGWVTLYASLPFEDGKYRRVQFVLGREREIGGYRIECLLMDSSIMELWVADKLPPTVSRFVTYPLAIGSKI